MIFIIQGFLPKLLLDVQWELIRNVIRQFIIQRKNIFGKSWVTKASLRFAESVVFNILTFLLTLAVWDDNG